VSKTDEFVPVVRSRAGRTQRWVESELRTHPGEWLLYPQPVEKPQQAAYSYPRRHPGTRWAVESQGRLGAVWLGGDA